MPYLLAIDAGTTSVKAGIFAPDGRCLGIGRQEYQLDTPAPDRVQLDPEIYWQSCVKTVREALEQSGVELDEIKALGVSSQGETTITLDAKGNVIYPALVWLDNRAVDQATFTRRPLWKNRLLPHRHPGDHPNLAGLQDFLDTRE